MLNTLRVNKNANSLAYKRNRASTNIVVVLTILKWFLLYVFI